MLSGALGTILRSTGGWWHPGASLDADFAGGRLFGGSDFASAFPITRASVGYAADSVGNWTQFGSGLLRRTNRGLLPEEARTNSIRNNSMQGAAAGTPGTLPTNWAFPTTGGITREIVGIGTEKGVDYIDIRLSGTPSGSGASHLISEGGQQIAAVQNQIWSSSYFLAIVAGSTANLSAIGITVIANNAAGTALTQGLVSVLGSLTSSLTRFTNPNITLTDATTAFVNSSIRMVYTAGLAVDITLRIGWPQLELGAFATSPIRTTSAAATKAADAVTMVNPSNYASPVQGSAFVEWDETVGITGVTRYFADFRIDNDNAITLAISSTGKAQFVVAVGGVNQAVLVSTISVAAGNRYKMAVRWEAGNFAMRCTASLVSPPNDLIGTTPVGPIANIAVGDLYNNPNGYFNDYIRRFTIFKYPLSDAQLTAMVA